MWDNFKIGKLGPLSLSVHIVGGLGENEKDYWWHYHKWDLGGRVSKDSQVGKDISALVKSGAGEAQVDDFMLSVAFRNIPTSEIVSTVKGAIDKAFKDGESSKMATIREALGIHE